MIKFVSKNILKYYIKNILASCAHAAESRHIQTNVGGTGSKHNNLQYFIIAYQAIATNIVNAYR